LIGKDKVEEIEKNISDQKPKVPSTPKNRKTHFIDTVTGYEFNTTLQAYLDAVSRFNLLVDEDGSTPIARLYEDLLGDDYEHADMHEHVMFGGSRCPFLQPEYDGWLDDNMVPGIQVTYDYVCL
jgi:hypothetical protein